MAITKLNGTKDILPEEIHRWTYVESMFREVCDTYGFKEIRTPVFESTELFKRGVGETTDIVNKEMYTFEDNGGRSLTLKPEGTAPVVRALIENKIYANGQINKMFYITPCFRSERPQAGRQRQFHQFGVETFGSDSPVADAEVIAVAMTLFDKLGVGELELRINSIGCPECRGKYREILQDFLRPKLDGLCETCKSRFDKNPMRILDCKSPECQKQVVGAPQMLDYICDDCKTDFEELKVALTAMKVPFIVDASIVRGLDYYTKTAFEIITNKIGAQGTVCGGGRYNGLIKQLDGPDQPGVGFGMGIERLLIVMKEFGVQVPQDDTIDAFVAVMGDKAKIKALELIQDMRRAGLKVQMDLAMRKLGKQFELADRLGARNTLVLGDDELEKDAVIVKNMETKEQVEVPVSNILNYLKESR